MDNKKRFEESLYAVNCDLRTPLKLLSNVVKENCEEIRLRLNMPLAVTVSGETVFVTKQGKTSFEICDNLQIVNEAALNESFKLLCGGSVYAHEQELKNGYIMMKNGCRAGVCGVFNKEGFANKITSLNIRIAKEFFGSANDILKAYTGGGLLIAGPPGSGKTTVLRDLVRQLSCGFNSKSYRITVVDSRGEIGGNGVNKLGPNTDVLCLEDKSFGIEIALRTMFPNIIAFDEIGTPHELEKVLDSFNSGVDIITTAHIGRFEEIMKREVTKRLIKSGVIKKIALLPTLHGGDIKVFDTKELDYANV